MLTLAITFVEVAIIDVKRSKLNINNSNIRYLIGQMTRRKLVFNCLFNKIFHLSDYYHFTKSFCKILI